MIKRIPLYFISLLAVLLIFGCSPVGQVTAPDSTNPEPVSYIAQGEYAGAYWPTNGWKTCDPKAVGMDAQKLAQAVEYAISPEFKTDGLVVIKNGYITAEAYFGFFKRESKHISYSMAKSFTSSLIGIAIDKGLINSIDEKVCQYYKAWDCDNPNDLRSRITIRHAMTLTTGLKWREDWSKWDFKTNDALKMSMSGDFVKYMSERPGLHEPGQTTYYSTGDPMLLTQVIQQATGKTAFEFGRENLFNPLNITNISWDEDGEGHTATAMGLHTTMRDYAKFGWLFLKKGMWEDQQIVSEQWVEKSTQTDPSVKMSKTYGYLWHLNLPQKLGARGSSIPGDAYMAQGVLGQLIVIIPSKDLVIVRLANQRKTRIDMARLITMVLDAEI